MPSSLPQFPEREPFARALFDEAARHLRDARVLHIGDQFPGSITSSMKAVELSLKSVLVLDGAAGWIDRLFQTHAVFTEIVRKYPIFQIHSDNLSNHSPTLPSDIELIEKLVPSRPDVKNVTLSEVANTEYPFYARDANPSSIPRLYNPGVHFTKTESAKHFNSARELLLALQTIYVDIAGWATIICPVI